MPTLASLLAFRASEATTTATRRWNASAYYAASVSRNRRRGGIRTGRRAVSSRGGTRRVAGSIPARGDRGGVGGSGAVLARGRLRARAADKFLKLSAQIVAWYDGWLPARRRGRRRGGEGRRGDGGCRGCRASGDGSTGDGSTADAAAPRPPRSWGASAGDDDLLAARADVDLFLRRVVKELIPLAASTVRSALGDAASDAVDGVSPRRRRRGDARRRRRTRRRRRRIVADRCAAALKQMATHHRDVSYDEQTLTHAAQSLRARRVGADSRVRRVARGARAPTREARERLAAAARRGTSDTTRDMAGELVASVRKTEASLNRLKDRKATKAGATGSNPGGDDAGKPTDTEKICKQLHLDVAEYAAARSRRSASIPARARRSGRSGRWPRPRMHPHPRCEGRGRNDEGRGARRETGRETGRRGARWILPIEPTPNTSRTDSPHGSPRLARASLIPSFLRRW